MNFNWNEFRHAGRLTKDPVKKTIGNSDKTVVVFSMASSRTWKDRDGNKHEEKFFIECNVWTKLGDVIMKYVGKGDPLWVAGHLKFNTWEDEKGKHSRHIMVVEDMRLLGSKKESRPEPAPQAVPEGWQGHPEDIPPDPEPDDLGPGGPFEDPPY